MTPSQLRAQWLSLCTQIGINGEAEWATISGSYLDSALAYHNLDHIADCLGKFHARHDEATDPIALELAIWYHDAIYDPRAPDNEEQSALLASAFLTNTPFHQSVSELIVATKHREAPATNDAALLCDIDLSILGSPPAIYQNYSAAIRQEYSWVPKAEYNAGRTKVLQHFLNRDFLFALRTSQDLYEIQARQNLAHEVLQLHD